MKFIATTLLSLLISATATAGNLDTANSALVWKGTKVTGGHFGKLTFKEGNIIEKDGKLVGGDFVVDMTSMTVDDIQGKGQAKLLRHLKAADFFEIEAHPTSSMKITAATDTTITADLTIKGKTHPVSFDYAKDGDALTGTMVFDRTKYDINYKSGKFFPGLGDKIIHDKVSVDFTLKKAAE
jgi:polyisoprenoid-binding protein YceI